MKAKEFLKLYENDGLVKEIATDYSGEKRAFKQAIDVLKQLNPSDKVKELFDLYSTANSVCEMAGLFGDYLEREVNTTGYYDEYINTL